MLGKKIKDIIIYNYLNYLYLIWIKNKKYIYIE